jgi:hypothetical protein
VKALVRFTVWLLLFGPAALPTQAAFSALYAFGDGVCTTTVTTNQPNYLFYGNRFCNGRVWLEVLAQRQGLAFDSAKNLSYFGQFSALLVANVSHFSAPTNVSTSLFVVWVNDADFVGDMENIYPSLDPTTWNNAVNGSLANHQTAVQTLYAKGVRTLIMPNAVDITAVPAYAGLTAGEKSFIHQMVTNFNAGFVTMLNQARASMPGLTIYVPDFFALQGNLLTHPANYGMVNPGIDALEDDNLSDLSLNGPGAIYVFWDPFDPTAKAHEIMADTVQQMVSPVRINDVTSMIGTNRLDLANAPIGLTGFVDGRTTVASGSWTSLTNFTPASAAQSVFVRTSGPRQFYRLRFPFAWSWP